MRTTKHSKSRLALALSGVVIFGLFAAAQWNDADGLIWAAIYSYVAILGIFMMLRIRVKTIALLSLVAYLAAAWRLAPWDVNFTEWMPVETGREAMGLAIAALWLGFFEISERRKEVPGTA